MKFQGGKRNGTIRSIIIVTLILVAVAALFHVTATGFDERRLLIEAQSSESTTGPGYRRLLASVRYTQYRRALIDAEQSQSPSGPGY
nr:hypothetical protein Itr_chr10CG07630 [Ipomoea trifida]